MAFASTQKKRPKLEEIAAIEESPNLSTLKLYLERQDALIEFIIDRKRALLGEIEKKNRGEEADIWQYDITNLPELNIDSFNMDFVPPQHLGEDDFRPGSVTFEAYSLFSDNDKRDENKKDKSKKERINLEMKIDGFPTATLKINPTGSLSFSRGRRNKDQNRQETHRKLEGEVKTLSGKKSLYYNTEDKTHHKEPKKGVYFEVKENTFGIKDNYAIETLYLPPVDEKVLNSWINPEYWEKKDVLYLQRQFRSALLVGRLTPQSKRVEDNGFYEYVHISPFVDGKKLTPTNTGEKIKLAPKPKPKGSDTEDKKNKRTIMNVDQTLADEAKQEGKTLAVVDEIPHDPEDKLAYVKPEYAEQAKDPEYELVPRKKTTFGPPKEDASPDYRAAKPEAEYDTHDAEPSSNVIGEDHSLFEELVNSPIVQKGARQELVTVLKNYANKRKEKERIDEERLKQEKEIEEQNAQEEKPVLDLSKTDVENLQNLRSVADKLKQRRAKRETANKETQIIDQPEDGIYLRENDAHDVSEGTGTISQKILEMHKELEEDEGKIDDFAKIVEQERQKAAGPEPKTVQQPVYGPVPEHEEPEQTYEPAPAQEPEPEQEQIPEPVVEEPVPEEPVAQEPVQQTPVPPEEQIEEEPVQEQEPEQPQADPRATRPTVHNFRIQPDDDPHNQTSAAPVSALEIYVEELINEKTPEGMFAEALRNNELDIVIDENAGRLSLTVNPDDPLHKDIDYTFEYEVEVTNSQTNPIVLKKLHVHKQDGANVNTQEYKIPRSAENLPEIQKSHREIYDMLINFLNQTHYMGREQGIKKAAEQKHKILFENGHEQKAKEVYDSMKKTKKSLIPFYDAFRKKKAKEFFDQPFSIEALANYEHPTEGFFTYEVDLTTKLEEDDFSDDKKASSNLPIQFTLYADPNANTRTQMIDVRTQGQKAGRIIQFPNRTVHTLQDKIDERINEGRVIAKKQEDGTYFARIKIDDKVYDFYTNGSDDEAELEKVSIFDQASKRTFEYSGREIEDNHKDMFAYTLVETAFKFGQEYALEMAWENPELLKKAKPESWSDWFSQLWKGSYEQINTSNAELLQTPAGDFSVERTHFARTNMPDRIKVLKHASIPSNPEIQKSYHETPEVMVDIEPAWVHNYQKRATE